MSTNYDLVVIGAGPAGQKAAIQGAKAGLRTLIVERGAEVGGECVQRGTIPSKTLRETAVALAGLRHRSDGVLGREFPPGVKIAALMGRQEAVRQAHERFIGDQLARNDIEVWHGRARFRSAREIEVQSPGGATRVVHGGLVVLATGSRPRTPPNVPVDHEHVLDSDSILTIDYLPASLLVLGSGVIASEYASIFASLGVAVTMVDRGERPLGFLDPEIAAAFLSEFERSGGRFLPGRKVARVESDGLEVTTTLEGGETLKSQKLLCAQGRVAELVGLDIDKAGIETTPQGHVRVDRRLQTSAPGIYAAGDIIGPPALAATAMEQGRIAVLNALGRDAEHQDAVTPVGIYTIPELSCVGLGEEEARSRFGDVWVGRARFREIARGQINGDVNGMLKLVADPRGGRLLGAHVVGDGATEIIHLAQLAMVAGATHEIFINNTFNFPTLAEAYRVAALDIEGRRLASLRRAA